MASGDSEGPSGADEPAWPSVAEARQALDALAGISDVTERLLEAAAIIQEQLEAVGTPTAVVGGLAVAYWTRAQYITTEIDVLMPVSPRASQVLEDLGFRREGRFWICDQPFEIVFEAPGTFPDGGDEIENVETPGGRKLNVLKVEDMVLWRFREVIHWGWLDAVHQTLWLLDAPLLDRGRLEVRASKEGLLGPLLFLEARAADRKTTGVPFTHEELRTLVGELKAQYREGSP